MRITLLGLVLLLVACEGDDAPSRTCDAPDGPAACLCSANPPTAEPIMPVDTCSAESVAQGGEGLCCETDDRLSCECASIGCYANELGICTCGTSVMFAGEGTAAVASCEADDASDVCCLNLVAGRCRCSPLTCESEATEVASCTTADIAVCGEGFRDVDSCT